MKLAKYFMLILALILLVSCGGEEMPENLTPEEKAAFEFDQAVERALLEYHEDMYEDKDCSGIGFVVMGQENVEGKTFVYTINMYGVYEEIDDAMCKVDGHSCIPMVVVLDEKTLKPIEVKEPIDGPEYYASVEEMFPEEYYERIFNLSIDDYTSISAMEANDISEYLKKKGKEMVIKQ